MALVVNIHLKNESELYKIANRIIFNSALSILLIGYGFGRR